MRLPFTLFLFLLGSPFLAAEEEYATQETAMEFSYSGDDVVRGNEIVEEDFSLKPTDKITVNYPNQDIRRILRNIADLYDINLVIPDGLVGKASIKLRDVTWNQVFDILLKPVGYTYTQEGNVIRVVSLDEIFQEPMTIRTFPVKYAKAADVAVSLGPIIQGKGGEIQVDNRSNTLVVKDRPSVLLEIEEILRESTLDRPAMQVMIETKFIEVSKTVGGDNDGLGINWWDQGALFGAGNDFLKVMGQLDVFNNFGGSQLKTAVFGADQYTMVLKALETTNCINLVANPTIVTLNNEMATFHVGKNQPIIEANFDELTGNFTVGEVDYLPVGVQVEVTPRVNSGAEQIALHIKPKVSRIVDFVTFGGVEGADGIIKYPVEAIRETESNVSIKNGYTLALGGLIQDDDICEVKKVPLLGDLPCVGRIFQQHKKTKDKINLIMFITAKTLNPDGSTFEEIIDPRQIANMNIDDTCIPGYTNGIEAPGMKKMTDRERRQLTNLRSARTESARAGSRGYYNAKAGEISAFPGCEQPCKRYNPRFRSYHRKTNRYLSGSAL